MVVPLYREENAAISAGETEQLFADVVVLHKQQQQIGEKLEATTLSNEPEAVTARSIRYRRFAAKLC